MQWYSIKKYFRIFSKTTYEVIVTVNDSSGVVVANPSEIFSVKVSNQWDQDTQYYWTPGAGGPLSSNINGIMNNNNDGTYSFSYKVDSIGNYFY